MAYPAPVRRATAVSSTTNATSWTPSWTHSLNTAIAAGEEVLWVAVVSGDGAPTLSETGGNGWTKEGQASQSTNVTGAIFTKRTNTAFAAGTVPPFILGSSATEQFSATLLAYKAGAGLTPQFILAAAAATGSSTNSNPPAVANNSGASIDAIVVATRHGDSNIVATVAPTNYSNLVSRAGGGTAGASTNTAERQITIANAASEDPGTFTSATEQWVSWTFAVYEADTTAPTITSSNTISTPENAPLAHTLTADESVTWSILGGADQYAFEISGSTLRFLGNSSPDFEAPADDDGNNAFLVTVRATDGAGNTADQAITITVTDVSEGGGSDAGWTPVSVGNVTIGTPEHTIVRSAGSDGWNNGAHSVEAFAGDVAVEVTVSPIPTSSYIFVGLDTSQRTTEFYAVTYAVTADIGDTYFRASEGGSPVAYTDWSRPDGTVFGVRRVGTTVEWYYRDPGQAETIFHTRSEGVTGSPLYVAAGSYTASTSLGPIIAIVDAATATEGIIAGSLGFSGDATGTGKVSGQAGDTVALTGTAAGTVRAVGTATGSLGLAGSATGKPTTTGQVVGGIGLTGSSIAASPVTGVVVGALPLAGVATGSPVATGSATGSVGLTGSAAGEAVVIITGSAAGTLALVGSTAGTTAIAGSGAGSLSLSGSAAGSPAIPANATGGLDLTGVAAGSGSIVGTATGPLTIMGSAAGTATTSGTAIGTLPLSGSASSGATTANATAAGTINITGTAAGTSQAAGDTTGSLGLAGSAFGTIPATGTLTGALALSGAATGAQQQPGGIASGSLNLSGSAAGVSSVSGIAGGEVDLNGAATGETQVGSSAHGSLSIQGSGEASIAVFGVALGSVGFAGEANAFSGTIRRPTVARPGLTPTQRTTAPMPERPSSVPSTRHAPAYYRRPRQISTGRR